MLSRMIGSGLRETLYHKKLIFLFWLINLVISLIFLLPYISAFNNYFSERSVSFLLEQANIYTYYIEFFHFFSQSLREVPGSLITGKIFILVISLLLSAGVISAFLQKSPLAWKVFWLTSLKFTGRMLRLGILQLFMLVIFLIVSLFLFLPVFSLRPSPSVESVYFYLFSGWAGLAFLLILLSFLIFDLSRIQLVYNDSSSVLKSFWTAVRSFMRNPFKIYFLYFLLAILFFLMVILYWRLQRHLSDTSGAAIMLEFMVLQIFIWLQYWIRLSRFSVLINFLGIQNDQEGTDVNS